MTSPLFDELVHAPARLRICAALAPVEQASFVLLRETTELSASALSKHLSALAEARYVQITKTPWDGRLRTWVALTRTGRRAYAGHITALREIVDGPPPPAQKA